MPNTGDCSISSIRNKLLTHATPWMNFKSQVKGTRHKRPHTEWFHLLDILEQAKLQKHSNHIGGC